MPTTAGQVKRGRAHCDDAASRLGSAAVPGESRLVTIVFQLLDQILGLYWWAVILAAVMSNLVAFGVLDSRNRLVWTIADFLYRITEPALRRIRAFLPSFGGIDLSPLVLLLLIWVIRNLLGRVYQAVVFGGLQPLFY